MKELQHLSTVPNGAIVEFPYLAYSYMKVSTYEDKIGVIRLTSGRFISKEELEKDMGLMIRYIHRSLDEYYYGDC